MLPTMANTFLTSQDSTSTLQNRSRSSFQRHSYPRNRAVRACQICRARRIKCDNKKPACSSCEKSGAECITNEADTLLDAGSLQILQRIDDLERLLKTLQPPETPHAIPAPASTKEHTRQLGITTENLLSWTVFQGRYDSHRDLKTLLLPEASTSPMASPMSIDSSLIRGDLEPASYKLLLVNFFRFVHVKNPVLDEGKVRQIVHRISLEGPGWDPESCLALLVCALGSIASSFDMSTVNYSAPQIIAVAESYYNAAQKRLGTIIGSGGVLEAQCFFYSGVYLMSKLRPLRAWRLFSQALACCQGFECANPPYQSSLTHISSARQGLPAEECVYWSCWKSELELRILLNLPDFAFDDLSYPLLFPTPPESIEGQQATSWYFYLSEISLRRLEHRVRYEISNALKADEASFGDELHKTTRAVERLAEEWIQSLPPAMSLHTPQEDDDVLKFILRGHFLNLWEVIYWPWLDAFINRRINVPEVETYVAKALQIGIDRIRSNKPGFRHRHHGTWLMLQSCTRSALVLLAAAYVSEAAVLLPGNWKEAVFETTELLRFWQYEAGDAANRLHILEELTLEIA